MRRAVSHRRSRAATLLLAGALSAGLASCYVAPDPGGFPGDEIARFEVTDTLPVPADGQERVHLKLLVDPNTAQDTVITVETSSGVLSMSADPTAAEARKITPKNLGSGVIDLTLRVGVTPGATLVTANVGGYLAQVELELSPSPPAKVVLSSTKKSLPADGESKFDVTAQLLSAGAPAQVSLGARVRFAVCCPGTEGGNPVPCASADPLDVPAEAQLESGQSIGIVAATERILVTTGGPTAIPALIVADAAGDEEEPAALCAPPGEGAVRDTLSVMVLPIKPES